MNKAALFFVSSLEFTYEVILFHQILRLEMDHVFHLLHCSLLFYYESLSLDSVQPIILTKVFLNRTRSKQTYSPSVMHSHRECLAGGRFGETCCVSFMIMLYTVKLLIHN
jgi:hypothetical protein